MNDGFVLTLDVVLALVAAMLMLGSILYLTSEPAVSVDKTLYHVGGDFLAQPFGSPQIETLLPLTYDGGVNRGHISTVRLVQALCENPARIFGLYPRKGTIAVGSDADLVVFDPNRSFTIRADNQHSKAGYTLYEGRSVLGWPEASFQRGRRVLWQGEVVAEAGQGRFLATLGGRLGIGD